MYEQIDNFGYKFTHLKDLKYNLEDSFYFKRPQRSLFLLIYAWAFVLGHLECEPSGSPRPAFDAQQFNL